MWAPTASAWSSDPDWRKAIRTDLIFNRTESSYNAGFRKPALFGVCAAAGGILGAALCESLLERNALTVPEYVIRSPKLHGRERRLVFLSDLHNCQFGKNNERLIRMISALRPDAVLIGGGMMTVKLRADIRRTVRLAEALAERFPVFYGDGNHESRLDRDRGRYGDMYDVLRERLEACGVVHLPDGSADLDPEVRIFGLTITENYYTKIRTDRMEASYISSRIGDPDPRQFNILLMHSPIFLEASAAWGADLVLSGHFHGGTIRLPGNIGLMTPQFQFFSKVVEGRHEIFVPEKPGIPAHACTMLVSAGLGTHSVNLRINNCPEIVLAVLQPGNEE